MTNEKRGLVKNTEKKITPTPALYPSYKNTDSGSFIKDHRASGGVSFLAKSKHIFTIISKHSCELYTLCIGYTVSIFCISSVLGGQGGFFFGWRNPRNI